MYTFPVFPMIWNSERCSRTIERKYGKIAKRSTRFIGSMKNFSFFGEQVNLTTYSIVKYTAVNASTQTIAAITCALPSSTIGCKNRLYWIYHCFQKTYANNIASIKLNNTVIYLLRCWLIRVVLCWPWSYRTGAAFLNQSTLVSMRLIAVK